MQSEFFLGVFGFGVLTGGGVLTGAGVLVMTGLVVVVVGSTVGFGVSSFAIFSVGEAEGDAVGDLLAETVAEGEAVAVGVGVTSVTPLFA